MKESIQNFVLTAGSLQLSPFTSSDIDGLLALFHDAQVRKYLWDDNCVERDTVQQVVCASALEFREGRCGLFSLRRSGDHQIIGFCGMRPAEFSEPATELMYALLPEFWGRGWVTAACVEVIRYAVRNTSFERLVAATDAPNLASVRVMERLGMGFDHRGTLNGLDTLFYSFSTATLNARYSSP